MRFISSRTLGKTTTSSGYGLEKPGDWARHMEFTGGKFSFITYIGSKIGLILIRALLFQRSG